MKKKLNIVISGLEKSIEGDKAKMEKWIRDKLEINKKLVEVWTAGREKKVSIGKCRRRKDKERIMKRKSWEWSESTLIITSHGMRGK